MGGTAHASYGKDTVVKIGSRKSNVNGLPEHKTRK